MNSIKFQRKNQTLLEDTKSGVETFDCFIQKSTYGNGISGSQHFILCPVTINWCSATSKLSMQNYGQFTF